MCSVIVAGVKGATNYTLWTKTGSTFVTQQEIQYLVLEILKEIGRKFLFVQQDGQFWGQNFKAPKK